MTTAYRSCLLIYT